MDMWKELVLKRPVIGKLLSKHYNSLFTKILGVAMSSMMLCQMEGKQKIKFNKLALTY
ncbi:hypothetical protein F210042A8_08950 [Blautia parvula]